MDMESGPQPLPESTYLKACRTTLLLAYQSFGVVYGDLCISPIYVYKSTFSGKMHLYEDDHEVLGVLSLIFWTLTLIPLFKYMILVLGADDNGEGGTFALYSLMCRNSRIGLISTPLTGLGKLSSYNMKTSSRETQTSLLIKNFFEKHQSSRIILLLIVLLGTSMVVGDGILTPTMSVLSAVSGIRTKFPELHENHTAFIACVILVGLFALQHHGTHRVGFLFAPVLISWLVCISGIGIYNIFKWNPSVVHAISPCYIYNYFKKAGKDGWSSLGSVVLCVTGAEAMFADLGHFSKLSIRIAFIAVVYPCLVVAYMGEAAFLSKHKEDLKQSFYKAIPESVFWPVFIIATLATIVGSQAIISATFSIISQCRALGCFPRVKIKHTSSHIHGQIYIPEVNWFLMFLCLSVTIGFRDTQMIGHAYGLAVITVMFVTTCLMFLIITTVWKRTIFAALVFIIAFGSLELLYFSACLAKVPHGGWLPLLLSLLTLLAMSVWFYGTLKKQAFEFENKVCLDWLLGLGKSLGLARVPGVSLVYSNTVTGIPPVFAHFVTNFPAFHRILIFVSLQRLTIPKVSPDERFLIGRVGLPEYRMFRCIVRYGYKDGERDSYDFENQLLMKVAEFLQQEGDEPECNRELSVIGESSNIAMHAVRENVEFECKEKVRELMEEKENGVAYLMGHTYVVACDHSPFIKKLAIDAYAFLRRNSRQPAAALSIPHASLIEVGMVYHV